MVINSLLDWVEVWVGIVNVIFVKKLGSSFFCVLSLLSGMLPTWLVFANWSKEKSLSPCLLYGGFLLFTRYYSTLGPRNLAPFAKHVCHLNNWILMLEVWTLYYYYYFNFLKVVTYIRIILINLIFRFY